MIRSSDPAAPDAGTKNVPAYMAALNAEQRAAVEALDGPVLMLAGAGTGKTRALTTRLAHLLYTGQARPWQILAVTFTNKAAREMKQRIGQLIGDVVEGMQWLGTFHSIGVRILRRHAELAGLKPDFTILDTDDQIRLLKQLIKAENIDEKRWPARRLAGLIDGWKNRGLLPGKVPVAEAEEFAAGRGIALYGAYQARLKILNAVDFGDLLLENLRLLQENPEILAQYQDRFAYMLVDEYQDTNVVQYLWLRLLAQKHRNICCVGDDDQSIYGWRGAEVTNILRFETDFPGAKVVRLERNYRSTGHILAAASHLISHNEDRLGKTLHTEDEAGEMIRVAGVWDGDEEARRIADEIESLHGDGHALNEMAVLVRASFQMREFEDRFIARAIDYRVIGGPRFYERAEIRDAIAYLQVVANPDNDVKLERIINTPRRGIGAASLARVSQYARAEGISLMSAARQLVETDEIRGKARTSLRQLIGDFDRWRDMARSTSHTDLAGIILDESGYTAMWQADTSPQAPGRLENLKELVSSMAEFEDLAGFLEHVSLVMDSDAHAAGDKVNLMTMHAAKGLEFDTVFLPGWEEGLFPHQRSLDESGRAGLEEERRLAYVCLTRARKRARVYYTANRRIHALWQSALPSRFVDELPADHVESGADMAASADMFSGSRFDRLDRPDTGRARQRAPVIAATYVAHDPPEDMAVDERIFHQKFGYGRISAVDGPKLIIEFDKAGRKRVLAAFVTKA